MYENDETAIESCTFFTFCLLSERYVRVKIQLVANKVMYV
jgi:hypothetical protein